MTGFVVLGTDTDAGKTAFCLQWLCAFPEQFAYWKPVETGESDTETVRRLVPAATVFPPVARFSAPVAPVLAATLEGRSMPDIAQVLAATPAAPIPLIVETFGSPLSPFTEYELQAELISAFGLPTVLVASSTVGAVGRTLQAVAGMSDYGLRPVAIVLAGQADVFAAQQIERHSGVKVFALQRHTGVPPCATDAGPSGAKNKSLSSAGGVGELPHFAPEGPASVAQGGTPVSKSPPGLLHWTPEGVRSAVATNQAELMRLLEHLTSRPADPGLNLIERDRASVWHPYTSLGASADPLPVVGAEAEFLELADGRRIIDGISSWWTILQGHRHPPLVHALREASQQLDHTLFAGVTHSPGVELAERLLASAPWRGGRVFFSDNGSTAVEVALKLAYQAWCHRGEPGRQLFVGFENSYHGDTFGAMAAGRDPLFFGRFEPLLFRTLKVPVSAEHLDAVLRTHPGEVAGVILEPLVQGAGGMRIHPPSELSDICAVARKHGVFFIADEVMTGCGRTGTLWAHQQAGIAPDLICAAKTLAGGLLPLAATLVGPGIVEAFESADPTRTFFHGHSFTGHPLACAVAVANWDELETGRWRSDASRIEAVWRERLELLRDRPGVADVRICGTIAAIEFRAPGGYLSELGPLFRRVCLEHGVLLRPLGNVLYAMPPLRTRDGSIHRIADAMTACTEAVGCRPEGP
jgi:adenosylmethionine-8-amino-7-oxononanoate aminotransferase